jgi:hypothetical protein
LISPSAAKVVNTDSGVRRAREYNDFIVNWGVVSLKGLPILRAAQRRFIVPGILSFIEKINVFFGT